MKNLKINICNECSSEYFQISSQMQNLCPECAHYIYNYKNCTHEFKNSRCVKCYWNGINSEYVKSLKNDNR
jgi:predicted RNA-binding Zn-ribbon protein involved in translation (DUF1610 family)